MIIIKKSFDKSSQLTLQSVSMCSLFFLVVFLILKVDLQPRDSLQNAKRVAAYVS